MADGLPAEGVWATRFTQMQYRPDLLSGFIVETDLTMVPPCRHPVPKTSVGPGTRDDIHHARGIRTPQAASFTDSDAGAELGNVRCRRRLSGRT